MSDTKKKNRVVGSTTKKDKKDKDRRKHEQDEVDPVEAEDKKTVLVGGETDNEDENVNGVRDTQDGDESPATDEASDEGDDEETGQMGQLRRSLEGIDIRKQIAVFNIREASEEDLKNYFEKFGKIADIFIPRNKEGYSKGYGFVSFASQDVRNRVLRKRHQLNDAEITVTEATHPKRVREGRSNTNERSNHVRREESSEPRAAPPAQAKKHASRPDKAAAAKRLNEILLKMSQMMIEAQLIVSTMDD